MVNESGILPKGWRVLIKPMEVKTTTASGIIVTHGDLKDREEMANTTGIVVELGEEANGWASPGDKVVFAKYAGLLYLGKDGNKYRVINDDDIVAKLEADVQLVDPYLAKGV